MKKLTLFYLMAFPVIFLIVSSFYSLPGGGANARVLQDTLVRYKDGNYIGQSRSSYTAEPYWGKVRITVHNGTFTTINFMIRDSNLHETFDGNYEKHFKGIPEYIQQSRNDWKGVQIYPKKLAETQSINKVDAMSGATWSYNIFKASLEDALKNAK